MPALKIECPNCGTEAEHPVITTQQGVKPLPYIGATPAVYRRTGRTSGFRVRVRRCIDCHQNFDSVEMPKEAFDALLAEFSRYRIHLQQIAAVTDEIFHRKTAKKKHQQLRDTVKRKRKDKE